MSNVVHDRPFMGETWLPAATADIYPDTVFEIKLSDEVDSTTLDSTSVILTDTTTGLVLAATVDHVFDAATDVSRIRVVPTERLEWGHRISLRVTSAAKFTAPESKSIGELAQAGTVTARVHPGWFLYDEWMDLLEARVTATTDPWHDGYDSAGAHSPVRDMLNTADIGITAALARVPNAYVGTPTTSALAKQAWNTGKTGGDGYGFWKEMSAVQALAWGWRLTATAGHRNRIPIYVMDWIDNFGPVDMQYTDNPLDSYYWSTGSLLMMMGLDLVWETASCLTGAERTRIQEWLADQAKYLATQWAPKLASDYQESRYDLWIDTAVYAIGRMLGNKPMRDWAYDGSAFPSGWATNPRPMTKLWLGTDSNVSALFDSNKRYLNEASEEALGPGQGFVAAIDCAQAFSIFFLMRTLDGDHDTNAWNQANTHGDTLSDVFTYYVDYIDGTTAWDSLYKGNTLNGRDQWRSAIAYGLPAAIYKLAAFNNVIADSWDTLVEPVAEGTFWYMGGNLAYWPLGAAMGADSTAAPDVTSASAPDKGASWIRLTWTRSAPTDERDLIKEVKIYETAPGSALRKTVGPNDTDTVISGLTANTAYTYSIRTVDTSDNEATGASVGPTTTETVA